MSVTQFYEFKQQPLLQGTKGGLIRTSTDQALLKDKDGVYEIDLMGDGVKVTIPKMEVEKFLDLDKPIAVPQEILDKQNAPIESKTKTKVKTMATTKTASKKAAKKAGKKGAAKASGPRAGGGESQKVRDAIKELGKKATPEEIAKHAKVDVKYVKRVIWHDANKA